VVRWPSRARVDAALESGDVVGTAYDPMLGKIIAHGPTRETARQALVAALDDTAILGLTTNVGFLRALAASAAFRDGEVHTGWLDANPGAIRPPDAGPAAVLAAWAVASGPAAEAPAHPFGCADGWRLAGPPAATLVGLAVDGEHRAFSVSTAAGTVATDERTITVRPLRAAPGLIGLEIDGDPHHAVVRVRSDRVDVSHLGHTVCFDRSAATGPRGGSDTTDGTVLAPMPGTVLAVSVSVGDDVEAGAVLGVMEAMKMEVTLRAPAAGAVLVVAAEVGATVALGATLFVIDPQAE